MSTKSPRVNTVLEQPLFQAVETLAKQDGVSLSQKVRDLVREALDLVGDQGLEAIVRRRRKAGRRQGWVSHAEVKKRLRAS